jgi:hypothetical protein
MFISNRFKSDFSNHISFECNGLIAEYNTILIYCIGKNDMQILLFINHRVSSA